MKIIDLLNKIANGEEVPKKIKFFNIEYIYNDKEKEYQRYNEKLDLHYGLGEDKRLDLCLEDEVEILEEDKDILHIDDLIPPFDENLEMIWRETIKNHNKLKELEKKYEKQDN